ncbi:MAG: hypothetical protein ACEPOW_13080 [Bacteroidales bacterium]
MDEKRESFKKKLDQLIKLFRKLKDKEDLRNMPGVDPMMYQSFEMFLNNYEMMKDQITDDLLNQFGDQMQVMISGLIDQLKEQLGEDFGLDEEEQDLIKDLKLDIPVEENTDEQEKQTLIQEKLDIIDKKLKEPGLSPDDMDRLLEERFKLSQNS